MGIVAKGAELAFRGGRALATSPILPAAGGMAGAVAGAGLASVPMAGIGGAAGESARQLIARTLGFAAPETAGEAATDIGLQGAGQAAAQAGGKYILGPAGKAAIKGAGKVGKAAIQLVTKVKPQDTQRVFQNPGSMLPGVMDKAKSAWDKAATKSGIKTGEGSELEVLKKLKGGAEDLMTETYEKILAGKPVTAAEVQLAKQAMDVSLIPIAKNQRNGPLIALYSKVRGRFMDQLAKESPEMGAANTQLSKAFSAEKFKSLFPKNVDDSPALFRSLALMGFGGAEGYRSGDPLEGAAKFLALSPAGVGSAVALGGLAAKPARLVGPAAARFGLGFATSDAIKKRKAKDVR
jgi:hypothetical protein